MSFQGWSALSSYQTLVDYQGGTNPVYVGMAQPGQAADFPAWQIKKIIYDTNGNPTAVRYAAGTTDFVAIWDERTTYTYA